MFTTLYRIHKLQANDSKGARFVVKNIPYATIKTVPMKWNWSNPMVGAVAEVAGCEEDDIRYAGEDGKYTYYLYIG